MKFPLYHRPSALVFLDDETPYLEMLAMVLPREWHIRLYTRAQDFLDQAHAQSTQWEADVEMHKAMLDQWYLGKALPRLMLDYWRSQSERYGLTTVAVVDYAMPAGNGVEVLKAAPTWPTWRVLLTGKADEHTAVKAFNDRLIDRFVTKQTPELAQHLINALRQHCGAPLEFHESVWRNALRPSQQLVLKDRAVQSALSDWLKQHNIAEYVALPEPFGILALDRDGYAHWLQFEMHKDLPAAVELAKAAGHNAASLASIAAGAALSDAEWQQALGQDDKSRCASAIALGVGGHLIAAHFDQSALGKIGVSHNEFLLRQPPRGVDLE